MAAGSERKFTWEWRLDQLVLKTQIDSLKRITDITIAQQDISFQFAKKNNIPVVLNGAMREAT